MDEVLKGEEEEGYTHWHIADNLVMLVKDENGIKRMRDNMEKIFG